MTARLALGVAEPAGGPHGRRARVVRVGDGQLGGGQDRLAVALARARRPPRRSAAPGARGRRRSAPARGPGRTGPRAASAPGCPGCRGRGRRWRATSGWAAISSITSGMVSRVSPPAQSTGLLRLQRGGSLVSICASRSSGSGIRRSTPEPAMASAVTTPHPPAVVSTTTFGPGRQRLGGERRRGLERLLDGGGPGDAGLAAHAVEHLVVGGQRAGVAGRGPGPALGDAALDDDERLARRHLGEALAAGRGRRRSPRRRRAPRPWRRRGVPAEVVGRADRGGVAGRHGPADADAGLAGVVQEAADEVAALAGDADAPGRRVRGDDLGAQLRRRARPRPGRSGRRAGCRARRTRATSSSSARLPSSPASP